MDANELQQNENAKVFLYHPQNQDFLDGDTDALVMPNNRGYLGCLIVLAIIVGVFVWSGVRTARVTWHLLYFGGVGDAVITDKHDSEGVDDEGGAYHDCYIVYRYSVSDHNYVYQNEKSINCGTYETLAEGQHLPIYYSQRDPNLHRLAPVSQEQFQNDFVAVGWWLGALLIIIVVGVWNYAKERQRRRIFLAQGLLVDGIVTACTEQIVSDGDGAEHTEVAVDYNFVPPSGKSHRSRVTYPKNKRLSPQPGDGVKILYLNENDYIFL